MSEPVQAPRNGTLAALEDLNWPTLTLLLLTGGGNLLLTQNKSTQLSYEQQEAIAKIREIHQNLDDFEHGIQSSLANQNHMMAQEAAILSDTHKIVKRLEELQKADQMRGAP